RSTSCLCPSIPKFAMRVPQSDANFGIWTLAGDDVEIGAASHDLIGLQAQRAFACAFAVLDVVFVAVPGADEVRLVGGELLPEPGLVRPEHVLDLVHDHAFAAGAALVQSGIVIGVELALP